MSDLSKDDKRALRGEMTSEEYENHGMALFQKGLVAFDPMLSGPRQFPLSAMGRRIAEELRAAAQ